MSLPEHMKTGLRGEQLAARYLLKHDYKLIEANFRTFVGEIDIIARKNDTLCFIEVKTRSPDTVFPPSSAVDERKRERIMSTARSFIKIYEKQFTEVRFDIIEVILYDLFTADINHIQDAFTDDSFLV